MKTDTRCVHSGTYHDKATRGINSPIFTSSVHEYLGGDARPYPRYFNIPNQRAVVEKHAKTAWCSAPEWRPFQARL